MKHHVYLFLGLFAGVLLAACGMSGPSRHAPTAVGGSTTTYYADYYYRNTGQRVALLSGLWFDGSVAGLSCWGLSYASSAAGVFFGGRLIRKAS